MHSNIMWPRPRHLSPAELPWATGGAAANAAKGMTTTGPAPRGTPPRELRAEEMRRAGGGFLLLPAVQAAREAARRS